MKKIVVILLIIAAVVGFYLYKNNDSKENTVVDTIDSYNYVLYKGSTNLYKIYFDELKDILENNYNEEEYAKTISKLFVADFYDLKNKKSNTDIGGLDFIHPDTVSDFKKSARNTIYKFVGSSKELPEVKEVSVEDITLNDDKSYSVKLEVSYSKDLEYPKNVELRLVLFNEKLYIIEIK